MQKNPEFWNMSKPDQPKWQPHITQGWASWCCNFQIPITPMFRQADIFELSPEGQKNPNNLKPLQGEM